MSKEKDDVRDRYTPERVLENGRELYEALPHMNESELLAALRAELKRPGEKRKDFITRLHRKYSRFRQERELEEYLKE